MINWPQFLSIDARIDFWTIVVGIVCNASCAMLGCYLVLRRMSLLGDAISHAILPGLAVAFLWSGSLSIVPMFVGAVAVGLLTAVLTQTLHRFGRVAEDASLGVVFTSLFALGVILISLSSMRGVHLDTDCVLYGLIDAVFLETTEIFGRRVPQVLLVLVPVLGVTLLFVYAFWKELKIASFDPLLATAMGFHATLIHYVLMGMVSTVTVASFQAVGSILVVAMLIVPAATAHLLTDRLHWMMICSVGVGVLSAVIGCLWARWTNTTAAGMMAVVAGLQFLLAVLVAPRYGFLSKGWNNLQLAVRIAAEDVLTMIYRKEELGSAAAEVSSAECRRYAGRGWRAWLAVPWLRTRRQLAVGTAGTMHLTSRGRHRAQSLVRSHRLWEAYLDEHFQLPPDHLHEPAERLEHFIGPALQEKLAQELRGPDVDPHGKSIPPS